LPLGRESDRIRIVFEVQIESIESPLLETGTAASLALALVARAQTMGFLPVRRSRRIELDRAFLEELAEQIRRSGIAAAATTALVQAARTEPVDNERVVDALRATLAGVDASPHPEGEWEPARELVGDDLLARLLAVSPSSLRRYASGERQTPDYVAWRLHLVARVLADLIGSYNDYGIRRWFDRRRTALDGATPAQLFEAAESEDDERLGRVLALAEELTGPGAAA
jgi:hypothetical protein